MFITDLKNITTSRVIGDVGQSESLFSSHYDDFIEDSEKGRYTTYKERLRNEFLFLHN